MATKPTDSYKWGENADKEQLGGYVDEGWPDDSIPPKRTHFNWYQNLVGRWIGYLDDAVDLLMFRFRYIPTGIENLPHENGVYYFDGGGVAGAENRSFGVVVGGYAFTIQRSLTEDLFFRFRSYTHDGSEWVLERDVRSTNDKSRIADATENSIYKIASAYAVREYVEDRWAVKEYTGTIWDVPRKDGVYKNESGTGTLNTYLVTGDLMFHFSSDGTTEIMRYNESTSEWDEV